MIISCALVLGCLGWHARAIRRLHPHVEHITVADLEPVVKMGSELPENKETIGIDFVKGRHLLNFYVSHWLFLATPLRVSLNLK
jgi:hypothetical protein